jgi:hypothetical protein
MNLIQFHRNLPSPYLSGFHENSYYLHSLQWTMFFTCHVKNLEYRPLILKFVLKKQMKFWYTLLAYNQLVLFDYSFMASFNLPILLFKKHFTYTKINFDYIYILWCFKPYLLVVQSTFHVKNPSLELLKLFYGQSTKFYIIKFSKTTHFGL